jgi:hypothetical protein
MSRRRSEGLPITLAWHLQSEVKATRPEKKQLERAGHRPCYQRPDRGPQRSPRNGEAEVKCGPNEGMAARVSKKTGREAETGWAVPETGLHREREAVDKGGRRDDGSHAHCRQAAAHGWKRGPTPRPQ